MADRQCLAAFTNPGCEYPGYINFSREADGTISVHLRGDPKVIEDSIYICGFKGKDTGKLGRCTPGDDNCNNYCNMAPENGKMQDHPKPCRQVQEGATVKLTLTSDDFSRFLGDLLTTSQIPIQK